jgi:hypothetical protein
MSWLQCRSSHVYKLFTAARENTCTLPGVITLLNFVSESVIMLQIAEEVNNAATIAASVSHDIQYT